MSHMQTKRPHPRRKIVAAALVAIAVSLGPNPCALAEVPILLGVTEQMCQASFWSKKVKGPNATLATPEEIATLNAAILADPASNMNDLRSWSEETFDGIAYGQALHKAAEADAEYLYKDCLAQYDDKGYHYETYEEAYDALFAPMIENCVNPSATASDPILFGVATVRGYVRCFPSEGQIHDDPTDPDLDYQYQTAMRLGEPVVVKGVSADGAYLHVFTSCTSGWVHTEEVGLCPDKASWLASWDFDAAKTLVVCADHITTEESNYAPAISGVTLTRGTCLELAEGVDTSEVLAATNRSGHYNHIVWLPCRAEDGSLSRQIALIPQHADVHEGYLPLTIANVLDVSMGYLGNAFGWGGMLCTEDCSGFVRDVYRCFGLDLPRNTSWQSAAPVYKVDLSKMSDDEKAATIATLPPGSSLFIRGHEMIYLGTDGGKFYVISNMGSTRIGEGAPISRVRLCSVSSLTDLRRTNQNTWLTELVTATVPFYASDHAAWTDTPVQRIARR